MAKVVGMRGLSFQSVVKDNRSWRLEASSPKRSVPALLVRGEDRGLRIRKRRADQSGIWKDDGVQQKQPQPICGTQTRLGSQAYLKIVQRVEVYCSVVSTILCNIVLTHADIHEM